MILGTLQGEGKQIRRMGRGVAMVDGAAVAEAETRRAGVVAVGMAQRGVVVMLTGGVQGRRTGKGQATWMLTMGEMGLSRMARMVSTMLSQLQTEVVNSSSSRASGEVATGLEAAMSSSRELGGSTMATRVTVVGEEAEGVNMGKVVEAARGMAGGSNGVAGVEVVVTDGLGVVGGTSGNPRTMMKS
jgi:hypothetical protein